MIYIKKNNGNNGNDNVVDMGVLDNYIDKKIKNLINSAPSTLDTLNELADALGDDPNFATTVANQISEKADKNHTHSQYITDISGKADKNHQHEEYITELPFIIDSNDQPQTLIKAMVIECIEAPSTLDIIKSNGAKETIEFSEKGVYEFTEDLDDIVEIQSTTNYVYVKSIFGLLNLEKATVVSDELVINDLPNLRRLNLSGSICDNAKAMKRLAKGLRDRNNMAWGSIVTQNQDIRREVEDSFIMKDWYFGTDKTINKNQYYIEQINVKDIWESAEYGEGRTYAVADSEVSNDELLNHNGINEMNCLGIHCVSSEGLLGTTEYHHGLGVLGVIAMDNGSNVLGIAPKAEFHLIKTLNKEGKGSVSEMYSAISKATELNVDALNMSVGVPARTYDDSITTANKNICLAFTQNGNTMICAGGNEGTNSYDEEGNLISEKLGVHYPNDGSWSISVGSVDKNEKLAEHSVCSDGKDFLAMGMDVLSTYPGNKYAYMDGTSFACPIITGCVLLCKNLFVKKYKHEPSQQELIEYMSKRTVDMGLEVWQQGRGIFNFMAYNPNPKTVIKKQ